MGTTTTTVPVRADGMPGLTQGGYVAGLAAGSLPGCVRVRLRRPTTSGDELTRENDAAGARLLRDGELVAEARPGELLVEHRARPDRAAINEALSRPLPFPIPFPTCLGCGTAAHSLGLLIRPAPDRHLTIGSWTPRSDLITTAGTVDPIWVWTVLDCVTSWAIFTDPPSNQSSRAVTGSIAYHALRPVGAGETVTFWTWREWEDDRKVVVGGGLSVGDETVGWADQELVRTTNGMLLSPPNEWGSKEKDRFSGGRPASGPGDP